MDLEENMFETSASKRPWNPSTDKSRSTLDYLVQRDRDSERVFQAFARAQHMVELP